MKRCFHGSQIANQMALINVLDVEWVGPSSAFASEDSRRNDHVTHDIIFKSVRNALNPERIQFIFPRIKIDVHFQSKDTIGRILGAKKKTSVHRHFPPQEGIHRDGHIPLTREAIHMRIGACP